MTLKEKLDLLWKYLLLAVLFYGFYQLGSPRMLPFGNLHGGNMPHDKMMWFGDDMDEDMDISVEMEKLKDGDSTMVITINGEVVDLKDCDIKNLHDKNARVCIKKMGSTGKSKKVIKMIHKEMVDD